jgi:leucyl/phenylalanyl-tRNA--protein transferase
MADLPMSPIALRSLLAEVRRRRPATDARAELFKEAPSQTAMRWLMGTAYACHPKRIADLPHLVWHTAADLARGGTCVPDPQATQARPDTFAGVARDISPETVLAAARQGFFPLSHCGPLKWWTRQNRMVLFLNEQHIAKRLRRDMKKSPYRVTFDEAFDEVIRACAGPRKGRPNGLTWITPKMMRLYAELHDQGHVHSFEVWSEDGRLVGGGYGLAIGRIFFTESQFSRESNTSKMGFATLNHHLAKWGFILNDGKDFTPTIDAMGFRTIPRGEFEAQLKEHGAGITRAGPWRVEADLATIAA